MSTTPPPSSDTPTLVPPSFPYLKTQSVRCRSIVPGLSAYAIEFSNRSPYRRPLVVEDRFEVAVLLRGEASYESTQRGSHALAAGTVYSYNPGELHNDARIAAGESGLLVGFRVTNPALLGLSEHPVASRLTAAAPELVAAAHHYLEAEDQRSGLDRDGLVAAVRSFVDAETTPMVVDPLERARRLIEEEHTSQLYVAHLAEAAGMMPETFTRAFRRRYKTTPIDYRLRVRLRAGRQLLLARPDLTVTGAALQVGFESTRFFRMALRSRGHVSPQELRATYGSVIGLEAPATTLRPALQATG